LERARWPVGFRCPRCGGAGYCVLRVRARKTFQRNICHRQTSLIAGTLFEGTKLALTAWFLAIADWACAELRPHSRSISDGLVCFAGVTEVGCVHLRTVVGRRKPKELPLFHWVSTVLGNVNTNLSGAYHAFAFGKYAERYLGATTYRFNRRFELHALPRRLLVAAVASGPCPQRWMRMAETHC
jgi:hypothetical protein